MLQRVFLLLVVGLFCRAAGTAVAQEAPAQAPLTGEVIEAESNDVRDAENLQRIAPGATVSGTVRDEQDRDHFWLVAAADMLCDFRITCSKKTDVDFNIEGLVFGQHTLHSPEGSVFFLLRQRVPAGEHSLCISCGGYAEGGTWRLAITASPEVEDSESEPNNNRDEPSIAVVGKTMRGFHSRSESDSDHWSIEVPRRGVYRLAVEGTGTPKPKDLNLKTRLEPPELGRKKLPRYSYETDEPRPGGYVYYPVLEAGTWELVFFMSHSTTEGFTYTFVLEPFTPGVDDALTKQARDAIARGEAWLQTTVPAKVRESHVVAVEGLVLAALSGVKGNKDLQAVLAAEYVQWFAKKAVADAEVSWRGRNLGTASDNLYEAAIATLALAEAAEAGIAGAKELCERQVRFLLAAQQSTVKDPAWKGPIQRHNEYHGGWRYGPDEDTGDISIAGWCLVALLAADAAGVKVDGMRDAVAWGTEFVKRCTSESGEFTYLPSHSDGNNIRNSIGLLLYLLMDEPLEEQAGAVWDLDHHLPSGTQVDDGGEYILYYAYYGTRLNYLRGGFQWEAWRSVMIRQALRLQGGDGRWPAIGQEKGDGGDRYATALSVIILRICLNEVPGYLRPEARGF
ncbi:MAG: hypothetical protein IT463_09630 [Planctomycetes bacterium]|nr:hypothetical protein [Planctomycetota bacterium]